MRAALMCWRIGPKSIRVPHHACASPWASTAAAALCAPSLRYAFAARLATVLIEIPSSAAMSLCDLSRPMRSRVRHSRAVRGRARLATGRLFTPSRLAGRASPRGPRVLAMSGRAGRLTPRLRRSRCANARRSARPRSRWSRRRASRRGDRSRSRVKRSWPTRSTDPLHSQARRSPARCGNPRSVRRPSCA